MNQKELLIISITIFLTVMVWIAADLNHIRTTDSIPDKDPRFSRGIDVNLNVEVVDALENKK